MDDQWIAERGFTTISWVQGHVGRVDFSSHRRARTMTGVRLHGTRGRRGRALGEAAPAAGRGSD